MINIKQVFALQNQLDSPFNKMQTQVHQINEMKQGMKGNLQRDHRTTKVRMIHKI